VATPLIKQFRDDCRHRFDLDHTTRSGQTSIAIQFVLQPRHRRRRRRRASGDSRGTQKIAAAANDLAAELSQVNPADAPILLIVAGSAIRFR